MLKIKNAAQVRALPVNYIVDPDPKIHFKPGQIAQEFLISGIRQGATVSSGVAPVGIIDDIRDAQDDSTAGSGRITVWSVNGLQFETNQYELGFIYMPGMNLYCSLYGKFMPSPLFVNSPRVGIVVNYDTITGMLHATWDQPASFIAPSPSNVPTSNLVTHGYSCSKCKDYNAYAQANQPDGTYKCWNCRN